MEKVVRQLSGPGRNAHPRADLFSPTAQDCDLRGGSVAQATLRPDLPRMPRFRARSHVFRAVGPETHRAKA